MKGLNQDVSIRKSLFAAAGCMFSVVKILPLGSPKLGYQFWGPQTWDIVWSYQWSNRSGGTRTCDCVSYWSYYWSFNKLADNKHYLLDFCKLLYIYNIHPKKWTVWTWTQRWRWQMDMNFWKNCFVRFQLSNCICVPKGESAYWALSRPGFNKHFAWNVLVCVEMGRYTITSLQNYTPLDKN